MTRTEYNDLMVFENAEYQRNFKSMRNTPSSTAESGIVEMDTAEKSIEKPTDDIQVRINQMNIRTQKTRQFV